MKRITMLLMVVALVVAMLAMAVAPVFAQSGSVTAPNCEKGNDTAYGNPAFYYRSAQATDSIDKNYYGPREGKEQGAYCLQ
jgi:flagellar basal body-associated protein FliL